jgi:peptide/nickel transport system permease protein
MTVKNNLAFFGQVLRRRQLSSRLLLAGLVLTVLFLAIAIFSPFLVQMGVLLDPQDSITYPIHEPPSLQHWFGTSREGYDVVLAATLLSLLIGVPLGLLSGYLGGNLDRALLFLMDTIYTLPGLLLSITLSFIVGRGILNAAIAISISYIPQYYRVVRNQTASLKNQMFVEAAQALGASTPRY